MKKYFYLAAVSALMLTACSSENDVVQPTTQPTTPQVVAQQQAVAFDTYLSGTTASTRAGYEGVMTTEKLKKAEAGFGVFAFYQDNVNYAAGLKPDFMYNQPVTWAKGWTYSPLKYWPNETGVDSQSPAAISPAPTAPADQTADKLSFFAYAPYVDDSGLSDTKGITAFTAKTATTDPKVSFTINTDPDKNVDLLWGVAPAGFSYTNVSGTTTSVPIGMPLKDLVKPDKDQKVKFLFQHALSRIGLSVVSAIDQIAAGDDAGTFSKDPTTKVLIKSVTITGAFGESGQLNLNNTNSNVAEWEGVTPTATSPLFTISTDNKFLAPDLRYDATTISNIKAGSKTFADLNTGVLPSEQPLLAGDKDDTKKVTGPAFTYGTVYYKLAAEGDKGYVVAKTTASEACDAYVKDGNDYKQVFATAASSMAPLDGYSEQLYKLTEGTALASGTTLVSDTKYFKKTGSAGNFKYTEVTGDGTTTVQAGETFFTDGDGDNKLTRAELGGTAYTGDCYTALIPRYYMVIPTGAAINITVNIKYAVVTNDAKLDGTISDVENDITKTVSVDLKNGKSYNLKLILGLTSVKLDATVADWKLADDTEIWLPQNNE